MEANAVKRGMAFEKIAALKSHLENVIIGQEKLTKSLIIALLTNGHLLVEGLPGLAKTKAIKTLASAIDASFHRIQFTPDLLPGDLTGTEIFKPETSSFVFKEGPIFHNLVLADEINRAPAKVQSALLESMEERQITIGQTTYALPKLFLVMATQNPIEQEGTYPLPEAQLDRFLMHIKIDYPQSTAEKSILRLARNEVRHKESNPAFTPLSENDIFNARNEILDIYLSEALENYMIDLVLATRNPSAFSADLANHIRFGVSPRATIAMDRAAKAHAWLHQRENVLPEDIHSVIHDIFRHRLILSFEAEAEGLTADNVIDLLLKQVAIA